ncbi:MAG: hypothetical protein JO154_21030 [Chitinophaga sp.]|uniref:hypothetical protein n=1 Tax=Chitinophaga sp. TaxID=1869181 RepID=UPI0025C1A60B|nr:hypothetical protein [Chitinophaga sp.]MBV8255099.1 hypothetical protein [Chitinophaga sp.]
MKFIPPLLSLLLLACNSTEHTPILTDSVSVSRSRDAMIDEQENEKAYGLDDFDHYVYGTYGYDSTRFTLIPTKSTITNQSDEDDRLQNTAEFINKDYQLKYIWTGTENGDSSTSQLFVNNKPVQFFDPQTNKEGDLPGDLDFVEGTQLGLYTWPSKKYLLIVGQAHGAQSWYRGILYGILVNVSVDPMRAYLLGTYEDPGDFYLKLNTNQQLTYISCMPDFGERGAVDSLYPHLHIIEK